MVPSFFGNVCVGITSIMVPSVLCTFLAYIIFLHVFSVSPFLSLSLSLSLFLFLFLSLSLPLSLSLLSLSLSLSLSMCLCGCKTRVIWCLLPSSTMHMHGLILFLINLTFHTLSLHSSYKIHQPFTDYFFSTTLLRAAWKTSFSLSGQPSSSFDFHTCFAPQLRAIFDLWFDQMALHSPL